MPLTFERLTPGHLPAVRAFNQRIGTAAEFGISESIDGVLDSDPPTRSAQWLVLEGDTVRGGVLIQVHKFVLGDQVCDVANLQSPLTEGVVSRKYATVGMWMMRAVVKRHPACYAVGMGGTNQPFPRLLSALGWEAELVPFLFYPHRPAALFSGLPAFSRGRLRKWLARAAAWSGVGWPAARVGSWRALTGRPPRLQAEPLKAWGAWVDAIWTASCSSYSVGAVRNSETLAALYPLPSAGGRCLAFRLTEAGHEVGWVSLLATRMRDSKHFGNLTVGTVLDCGSLPGYEGAVAVTTRRLFADLGTDISVLNHQHLGWQGAFRHAGYLPGPSNYVFARSATIVQAARGAGDQKLARAHITRGDGDGRIHL